MRSRDGRPLAGIRPTLQALLVPALVAFGPGCGPGEIRTPDDLVDAHLAARGGYDDYRAIRSTTSIGIYEEAAFRQVHRFDQRRPNLIRITTNYDEDAGTFGYCEGFDGAAWEYSFQIPKRVTGEPARALRRASEFEPSFVDYRAKGHRAVYRGIVELHGHRLHHLEIARSAGEIDNFFFDPETLMETVSVGNAPFHGEGKTIEILEVRSGFKPVAGVLMPHHFEQTSNGEVLSKLTWDSIQANLDVPDEWFSPPLSEVQESFRSFRESMLAGGTDEMTGRYDAYHELAKRQLRQELENELNTFGFELVSHDRLEDAVRVFRLALSYHPESGNLHDSLGEAYLLAGDTLASVASYRKAVEIDSTNRHAREILQRLTPQE